MSSYDVRRSWEQFDHSAKYLGCGSSTLSKAAKMRDAEPPLIVKGSGCRVWDPDGNEYIDFANALGPISLGHAVPEINEAIAAQLESGIIFGRPHPLEGEVAELLCEMIPSAERVRFLKTGGEAIAACIKIARAATGRDLVVQCGYNGWINTLSRDSGFRPPGIAAGTPLKGIPDALSSLHVALPWGEMDAWEQTFAEHGDRIAAVVIAADYPGLEKGRQFLPAVRELTRKHGTLMIMDEIVMGFRLAVGGAHDYFGVTPDLAVFAKGMANGMPISAYLGRGDLIDSCRDLSISSTFGGETLSLAAVKAVIGFYRKNNVIDYLWKTADTLWRAANALFERSGLPVRITGAPVAPRTLVDDGLDQGELMKALYRNGLLFYSVPYTSYSHRAKDVEETLQRLETAVRELSRAG